MSVARRITPTSIPPDWIVTFRAAELSLETLNLSKVPALADNVGRLLPSALAVEEAYMPPQGLIIDEIDREPVVLRGGHQLVCTERDKNLLDELTPRLATEGTDDDGGDAAAAAAAAVAAAKVSGTPCVSLRLANNHIFKKTSTKTNKNGCKNPSSHSIQYHIIQFKIKESDEINHK
jgi:hypothetical protein